MYEIARMNSGECEDPKNAKIMRKTRQTKIKKVEREESN